MTTTTPTVSFLGLGETGSALADAVLRAGHPTIVWNRTGAKTAHLVDAGAVAANTPGDAVDAGVLEVFRRYVDAAVADGHGADEVSRVASAMLR